MTHKQDMQDYFDVNPDEIEIIRSEIKKLVFDMTFECDCLFEHPALIKSYLDKKGHTLSAYYAVHTAIRTFTSEIEQVITK